MFSTKVLIEPGHLINFTSPILETGGELYVFTSHEKVWPFAEQRQYFHSFISRLPVLVRP